MASTPTTKSQVQAYRFVLRRMESALVRKDAVMAHDPMQTHKRAIIVGAVLALAGVLAFLILAVINPDPQVPNNGIVIGSPSGQVYVVSQNPHELIPVFNVASAKLLILAQNSSGSQQAPGDPITVNDSQLANIPMGRLTGIPDGPPALPAPSDTVQPWAVCDEIPRDVNAPNPTAGVTPQTTVLVGEPNIGTDLAEGQALLVSGPDGKTYLVYHAQHNINNNENDSAVRAEVDTSDANVMAALQIVNVQPRPISAALLNAIPEVAEIQNPFKGIATGQPGPAQLGGLVVGQSFEVPNAGGPPTFYAVVNGGIEQVTQTVAQIILYENSGNQTQFPSIPSARIGGVTQVQTQLPNIDNYPDTIPQIFNATARPVICLGWRADLSDPAKPIARTSVTVGFQTPDASSRVAVGQPNANGEKIDWFFMKGLQGVTVHAATNAGSFWSGPTYLVSARAVTFSVQDLTTAQGLGIASQDTNSHNGIQPAPASILQLLPSSSQTLSTQNVQHTYDSVPIAPDAGQYLTPTSYNAS